MIRLTPAFEVIPSLPVAPDRQCRCGRPTIDRQEFAVQQQRTDIKESSHRK